MRFNWLVAACVIAIAVMLLELNPGERTARLMREPSVFASAWKSALVGESATRRVHDTNQRDH